MLAGAVDQGDTLQTIPPTPSAAKAVIKDMQALMVEEDAAQGTFLMLMEEVLPSGFREEREVFGLRFIPSRRNHQILYPIGIFRNEACLVVHFNIELHKRPTIHHSDPNFLTRWN